MSSDKDKDKQAAYRPEVPVPRRPERPEVAGWPSPTPLPVTPQEDVGRTLKLILDRLDIIEKRLEKIEQALTQRQST
jgi:hypothetical protein